jgi:tRNA A-37 threonylcarbamoyl transferase component Bud32
VSSRGRRAISEGLAHAPCIDVGAVDHHATLLDDGAFAGGDAGPARRSALPGEIIDGKYRLVRTLGEGGMGVVFEAEHLLLRKKVAIKFLRSAVLALPEARTRFEREARASVRMRGRHVVRVLDVDSDAEGRPYIVMEHLNGRDLETELRARGRLPIAEAVDWLLQACEAVAEAHAAGIIHRDLKPSNLFLAEAGDGVRIIKVLDFGISKNAYDPEPSVTSAAMTVGTPLYMSPEQVRSSKDVDARTDIWALGVILYELAAGAPPFRGTTTAAIAAIVADATPSLVSVRRETPAGLERVVITALAKAREHRFPTVESFAAALMPFASPRARASARLLPPMADAMRAAKTAMARIPSGPRVTDAVELLGLHPSETLARRAAPRVYRDALRTFLGTLVIGMGVGTAATGLARPAGETTSSATIPNETVGPDRLAPPRVASLTRVRNHHRAATPTEDEEAGASPPEARPEGPRAAAFDSRLR